MKLWPKIFQKNKSIGTNDSPGEFYQTFREELILILLKIFQKISEEGKLPNSFYMAAFTLIPKQRIPQKEIYRPASMMHIEAKKSSTKFSQAESNNTLKESSTMIKWGLSQGCKDSSIYANQLVRYTILTNWKIKAIWSCQQMQRKLSSKFNTRLW